MRFSFSAFVFHVFVLETTAIQTEFSFGSTKDKKKPKNYQHATAPPTPTPPVSYLVAQPGVDCSLRAQPANRRHTIGEGTFYVVAPTPIQSDDERYYTLRATVSNATIAFAERPTRTALTVGTKDFVDGVPDLFETSNPNGAITFVSEDTASLSSSAATAVDGPLIAVLSQPKILGTSPDNSTFVIEYNITQSESQSAIVSIETFMGNTFRSCSIFIDGCCYT